MFDGLLALDEWTNAEVLGGSIPGETISSALGRKSLEGRLWARGAGLLVDLLFRAVSNQRRHCLESICWPLLSADQARAAMAWRKVN